MAASFKIGDPSKGSNDPLRLSDCSCSICLYIFIEPVTLPCGHELCMPCFTKHVAETSLFCPMCRTRLSVWARKAARQNSLVNQGRWKEIQQAFPEQVNNRLNGIEGDDSVDFDEDVFFPHLAEPGELRREYEQEQSKITKEREERERAAEEASLRLIAQLDEQETLRQEQERKDLQLAAQISKELNGVTPQIAAEPADMTLHIPVPVTPITTKRSQSESALKANSARHRKFAARKGHVSPRGASKTPIDGKQRHLKMWFQAEKRDTEPGTSQPLRSKSEPVVRTTQLTPDGVAQRIEMLKQGEDPTSVSRSPNKRLRYDGEQPGTSTGTSSKAPPSSYGDRSAGDLLAKRLCLRDLGNAL